MKPSILILGTDHFTSQDNGDLFSTEKMDMLSPGRQDEIREVLMCLEAFKPTKIALEVQQEHGAALNDAYGSYLKGDYQLTVNEVDHIGFRLAKQCGHTDVFAVDWNKDEDGIPDLGEWKDSEEFGAAAQIGEALMTEANAYSKEHSLKEFLLWLNDPQQTARNQEMYMKMALMGSSGSPDGAIWTAKYWYYRNLLIYRNLVELIDSDAERIFVLYGSGHLHLLLQFLKESRIVEVEVASDYL